MSQMGTISANKKGAAAQEKPAVTLTENMAIYCKSLLLLGGHFIRLYKNLTCF